MNLSALKTFAPEVRRQLIEAVGRKLDYVLTAETADLRAMHDQRESLREQAELDRKGMIERVAYTWFNRLAALRFLDARGWHPFRARVITPATTAETQPELLKLMRSGALPADLTPFTDVVRLNDLLDGRIPSPDAQSEVYRHLVLTACRYYHALLPNLFEKLDDETELLLPDDLLTEHSIVNGFRTEISDEDCGDDQRANVEILGWLYQFYISEKKDQVIARKSAVPTEDIPAATQLFTPHWIVRYLVENSLGRLWLLNRPQSKLRDHMPYYIDGKPETDFLRITKPEEIRLVDPASGSGHMLTYAFDLLSLIYEEEGYAPPEIPALILRHNLYGLDICPRAVQLAELALVFKARGKSRRFFQPEQIVRPNIIELRNVCFEENELRDYIRDLGLGDLFNQLMIKLLHQFEGAKNFGSLIHPCLDESTIVSARRVIDGKDLAAQTPLHITHLKVLRVLKQAEALTQRYQIVVANPPYMGFQGLNGALKTFSKEHFEDFKTDLFSMFIARGLAFVPSNGFLGLMTPFTWMFLSSYENTRSKLVSENTILSLIRPEYHSFFDSAYVPICAFVIHRKFEANNIGCFIDLNSFTGADVQEGRALEAIRDVGCAWRFNRKTSDFGKIPGKPIAYELSPNAVKLFEDSPKLSSVAAPKQGLITGDNERFLRFWHEVELRNIGLGCKTSRQAIDSNLRWFPHHKGGAFRKWYGNHEYIVDWENDGQRIREFVDENGKQRSRPQNTEYYFKPAITWTSLTVSSFNGRISRGGFVYDAKGPLLHPFNDSHLELLGALLNSCAANYFLKLLAPTMDYNQGPVGRLPFRTPSGPGIARVLELARSAERIAANDWDNFETSWDFQDQPLLRPGLKGATVEASWQSWEAQSTATIRRMQELETENNRLFIAAYGLEAELQSEVPEEQITLTRAETRNDMAAFLSYAVGCMMGRYSLDHPGLILADAGDSLNEYMEKVPRPKDQLTFAPDEDGIIPVLDGEWFEDDIVARTRDFLRATFGEATLEDNLRFIEDSLGKDLRKYFVTNFYKDHLKTYKKRPIYWLFQSPKKHFRALVSLHRYTKDTANCLLEGYLREYLHKLRSRLEHLEHVLASESAPARELTAARKEVDQIRAAIRDCEYYERETLLPLAQKRLEIDLDDGVKINYLKFGSALAPIPGLKAK